jgi:hypothetical protein
MRRASAPASLPADVRGDDEKARSWCYRSQRIQERAMAGVGPDGRGSSNGRTPGPTTEEILVRIQVPEPSGTEPNIARLCPRF